jgi:tetratricopeptide (TPR) repeat protein
MGQFPWKLTAGAIEESFQRKLGGYRVELRSEFGVARPDFTSLHIAHQPLTPKSTQGEPMTTERVRNHELEEFSLAALRLALPGKWVIHEFKRDYGIDVQLELFDERGMALGLRAYGQLKATDGSEDDDELSLDRDHLEYWSSHSDPVLLLRYFSATQSFQWCWLHEVAWSMKPWAGSLSVVRFLRPWSRDASAAEVATFLRERGQVLASRLLPPFAVSIHSRTLPQEIVVEMSVNAGELVDPRTFRVVAGDLPDAAFKVFVERKSIATTHLGAPGIVVTLDGQEDDLPSLVWLLIFLTACRYDRVLVARLLAQRHFNVLERVASGSLVVSLAEATTFALGLKQAAAVLKPFQAADTEAHSLRVAMTCMGTFRGATRFGELTEWAELLAEVHEIEKDERKASIAYSRGNALCSLGRWDEAVEMFQAAAISDPSYRERPYFVCEFAGSLFESGQYAEAARQYRFALELGEGARTRYLLGDALFCHGEFAAARVELLGAISAGLDGDSQTHADLIAEMCAEMVDDWGLPEVLQAVKYGGDTEVLSGLARQTGQDFEDGLSTLLATYASDGYFHFNAAHTCRLSGRLDLAVYRYFHCALRQRVDAEAWALGIASVSLSPKNVLHSRA